jgi:hypothetical protein
MNHNDTILSTAYLVTLEPSEQTEERIDSLRMHYFHEYHRLEPITLPPSLVIAVQQSQTKLSELPHINRESTPVNFSFIEKDESSLYLVSEQKEFSA